MRDPAVSARILSEDPAEGQHLPAVPPHGFEQMFRFGNPPNYQPAREDNDGGDRRARGPHAAGRRLRRAAGGRRQRLHLSAARQLRVLRFGTGEDDASRPQLHSWAWATAARMSRSSRTRRYQTFLFSYWGRDRSAAWTFPIWCGGRPDTGTLRRAARPRRAGTRKKADINVIDFDNWRWSARRW